MRLVSAKQPAEFANVVAAEAGPDQGLVLAYADGTVSHFDNAFRLVGVWLNPGKRVSCLVALDSRLFMAFDDNSVRVVSLETGITVSEATLPIAFTGIAVFERVLVGWSRHATEIHILHRFNLEIFETLYTDTFVLNVFSVPGGIGVATSSDLFVLRDSVDGYSLRRVFHASTFLILGAACFNKKWCVLTPRSWKVLAPPDGAQLLDEEMDVAAPFDTLLTRVVSTPYSTLIQCSKGMYIFLRENNIQAVASPLQPAPFSDTPATPPESPRASPTAPPRAPPRAPQTAYPTEYLVANSSLLVTSDLRAFQSCLVKGQLEWQPVNLGVELASTFRLVGHDDPAITAVHGTCVGTQTGEINGTTVFPSPVLEIDGSWAYSAYGRVKLPPEPVRLVHALNKPVPKDSRVSVQVNEFVWPVSWNTGMWTGLHSSAGYVLQRVAQTEDAVVPAHLAVVAVSEGLKTVEEIVRIMDTSLKGIATLENVAVLAVETRDDALLQAVAQVLTHIWDSQRVAELLAAGTPHAVKVLASMFGFSEIPAVQIQKIVGRLASAGDVPSSYAAAWVFEYREEAVAKLCVPFRALGDLSERAFARFALNMARVRAGMAKLLQDTLGVLGEDENALPNSKSPEDVRVEQRMAVKLLLQALELPDEYALPQTEAQLVQIVRAIVPAVHKRGIGAKAVLVKLLATHKVQFHQARQQLLVPTPASATHAALVIDMNAAARRECELEKPSTTDTLLLAFSADGKTVYGTAATKRYAWHLPGGIRSMFRSETVVEPVEVR